ncbi:MAG: preprotein translocase subunit YajC [Clostridia bacterium]|nr:preprotein translocase subunit YajC [Clostridia bacterium]
MTNLLLEGTGAGSGWIIYVVLLVLVVAMLIVPMITQKKRNKEYGEMVESLNTGDEIRTIGGIMGKIVRINKENGMPKSVVIETGLENSKATLEFDVSCIAYVYSTTTAAEKVAQQEKNAETTEEVATVEEVKKPEKTKNAKK